MTTMAANPDGQMSLRRRIELSPRLVQARARATAQVARGRPESRRRPRAHHRFVSPRHGMLPLVHPEGGIVLKKSSVPAGAGMLFVRLPQRKRSVRASPDSSIGILKELPRIFYYMVSLEADS